MKAVPLSRLSPGQKGRVKHLLGDGPLKLRLLDLGFVPGTEVEAVRRSPLGDPIAFYLRGALVALRSKDADLVLVDVLPGTHREVPAHELPAGQPCDP